MSIIPHGPFHESQPQLRFNSFEDLTTARLAVGEVKGFDDPITTELREDVKFAFSGERHDQQFQPKSYSGDEAKIIFRSLKAVAKKGEADLSLRAKDTLERIRPELPIRTRAALLIADIVKPEIPMPPVAAPKVGGELFADDETIRTEIEWKSKYDQSDPKNRPTD